MVAWSNVAAGTYTLTTKVYDSGGLVTTSNAGTVNVELMEKEAGAMEMALAVGQTIDAVGAALLALEAYRR